MSNGEVSVVKLHPAIHIYRGITKNPQEIINQLEATPTDDEHYCWNGWAPWVGKTVRGRAISLNQSFVHSPGRPVKSDDLGAAAMKELRRSFEVATASYLSELNVELTKPFFGGMSVNRYNPGVEMGWHTDAGDPNRKTRWSVTCNVYLNDDYEGGELNFRIGTKEEGTEILGYKPIAGDIIVFPSNPPFFHQVNTITSGFKYFAGILWQEELPLGTDPSWQHAFVD
jgi:predicted 2-oxoglutarate/Fe(II)-dependent dioxygenase YbiX